MYLEKYDLGGRTAVVTGGGQGIGFACAQALGEAGARVILGELLRMDRDAGGESSAMRLAKLSQLSTQMDQLMRRLEDNMEYMRDLSARVDLLATRSGVPTLGEYRPPAGGTTEAYSPVIDPQGSRNVTSACQPSPPNRRA